MEEISLLSTKERLDPGTLAEYREGCADIGLSLHTAVNDILREGKRPTIIIPSRGAIPITLIAQQLLSQMDANNVLAGNNQVAFYPECIFEYLSDGAITANSLPKDASVDVVLYPFTADISGERGNQEARELAQRLRYSASTAVLDLLSGSRQSLDLNWYYFLMEKMNPNYGDSITTPKGIVDSLRLIPALDQRQVILIDTVVSGRAAWDITTAFANLGHPLVSILAVNNLGGEKFKPELKREIVGHSLAASFSEFPLVSEDGGAALLGVTAVNFSNFNEPEIFSRIDSRQFGYGFTPQSCVWALPPLRAGQIYGEAYHRFLKQCLFPGSEEWSETKSTINHLMSSHGSISKAEIKALVPKGKVEMATETSSHIISVELSRETATNWVREFAAKMKG